MSDEEEDDFAGEQDRFSDNESLLQSRPKSQFNRRNVGTVIMMVIANFCSTAAFSVIAPFFPTEAQNKGLSETENGLIFGIYELICCIFCPIFGHFMYKIGAKFMCSCGLFSTGVTAVLFGLLKWAAPESTFLALSLTIRAVEGVGDAAFLTASYAIAVQAFPQRISFVVGLLEVFNGAGFTTGPVIGGFLYQIGGFGLPLFALGLLLILAGIGCVVILENDTETERSSNSGGTAGLVKSPSFLITMACSVAGVFVLSFLDPTLAPHLLQFKLSPSMIGVMFLISSGFYAVSGPLWGLLVDKTSEPLPVMICGSILGVVALLLIGPSPLFSINSSLLITGIALAILGLGNAALEVPTFQAAVNAAVANGYPDSIETYGLISGLLEACNSFGGFLGPTIGGVLVDYLSFGWAATTIAAIDFVIVPILIAFTCYRSIKGSREKRNSSTTHSQ